MFSLFSRRASRSAPSAAATGSQPSASTSSTSADAQTVLTSSGLTSCERSLSLVGQSPATLPQTKRVVLEAAVNRLFTETYFSVCTLDRILDAVDVSRSSQAYKLLATLHCVHFNQMSEELRQRLPLLVREAMTPVTSTLAAEIALRDFDFGD